jgi:hypothetical protein
LESESFWNGSARREQAPIFFQVEIWGTTEVPPPSLHHPPIPLIFRLRTYRIMRQANAEMYVLKAKAEKECKKTKKKFNELLW